MRTLNGLRSVGAVLAITGLVAGCQGTVPSGTGGATSTSAPSGTHTASPKPSSFGELSWEAAGNLATAKGDPHALLLPDDRVLVIGHDQSVEIWAPETNSWATTAGLNNPRMNFAAVSLSDGRVLVTGGLNDIEQSYSSAYVFDPDDEIWTKVGLMDTARTLPTAALLQDGRVLVAGGFFYVSPETGRSTNANVVLAVYGPGNSASPGMPDVVPPPVGNAMATAELFDPSTGTWTNAAPMNIARVGAQAVTLADGRVLVVGSEGWPVAFSGDAFETSEIYDPGRERFELAGQLPQFDADALEDQGVPLPPGSPGPGSIGTLVAMPDGDALLIGHEYSWKHFGEMTRSFRFDAGTGEWHEIGQPYLRWSDPMTGEEHATSEEPRVNPCVVVLPDGRVLVAGGEGSSQNAAPATTSAETYDPASDTWSPAPDLPEPRAGAVAVSLRDGTVLLVGGSSYENDLKRTSPLSTLRLVMR